MAVSPTVKIRIIGRKQEEKEVVELLQRSGLMEIEEVKEQSLNDKAGADDLQNLDYRLASIKFALDFLSKFSKEKKGLKQMFGGERPEISMSQAQELAETSDFKETIEEVKNLESAINQADNEIAELKKEAEALSPWASLKENPQVLETDSAKAVFGRINENKYLALIQRFNKIKLAQINKINQFSGGIFLEIIYRKEFENEAENIFKDLDFKKVALPHPGISPKAALSEISRKIKEREIKITRCNEKGAELAVNLPDFRILFDTFKLEKERLNKRSNFFHTESSFWLTGWIEERFLRKLISDLRQLTDYTAVYKVKSKENEERPVVIYNNSLWRPFEAVTNIYGLPKSSEVDPTPFLAPFFILFFALCLTDAVYGLILAAICFSAVKFLSIPKESQKLIKLLGIGGVVTFFIGALFGGWAGFNIENLMVFKIIDPLKNPILVLIFTLILGIIQVWSGILIAFCWKIKQREIKEAFLNEAVWLFFIPVICAFGLVKFGVIAQNLSGFINILLYLGIGLVVITGGRKQKNLFLKAATGVLKLYNLVGYTSDVLSYSRLLALGLATGIIAMVINLIAGIAFKSIPYVGILFAALILIFGHLFNIVINVLGAYIHSGRLQFVEFFPKFMEGGGRRFKPFSSKTDFVKIIN